MQKLSEIMKAKVNSLRMPLYSRLSYFTLSELSSLTGFSDQKIHRYFTNRLVQANKVKEVEDKLSKLADITDAILTTILK